MRTSEQRVDGPDDEVRALTARLADLCKHRPALFAAAVRQHDALTASGVDVRAAWRLTLEAVEGSR